MLSNHTTSSILERVLWERTIPDRVVNDIFFTFPLPVHISPTLKKAILLRRLASDTVLRSFSLKTLEILELIEEIDRENSGIRPSMAMKAAYCAIACSCTAAALCKSVADFLDVFVGIWVLRICDMEKSDAASLISDELRETRDIMWEAVKNSEARALLEFDESEETLERVRVYLEEVWEMESFSPALVADELYEYEEGLRRLRKGKGTDLKSRVIEMDVESENNESFHVYVTPLDPGDGANISKGYPKRLNSDGESTQPDLPTIVEERRVKLASAHEKSSEGSYTDGKKTTALLNKCLEPLCPKEMEDIQGWKDVRTLESSVDTVAGINEENYSMQKGKKSNSVPRTNLMEWNQTAHTMKWTDSLPLSESLHLPTSQRKMASPLKIVDDKKYVKRRKIRRWTLLEEGALIKAVKEHGKGNWKAILQLYSDVFEQRTAIDLKDKWRSMTKGYEEPS